MGLRNSPRISPFLWFDSNAEEAVEFYLSVFPNARRLGGMRVPDESGNPEGKVLTIAFELDGQNFTALNGGPVFHFTEAISFVVRCDSQREVDTYWEKLTAGGSEVQCVSVVVGIKRMARDPQPGRGSPSTSKNRKFANTVVTNPRQCVFRRLRTVRTHPLPANRQQLLRNSIQESG